jgi:hypothetical protein
MDDQGIVVQLRKAGFATHLTSYPMHSVNSFAGREVVEA